MISAIGLVLFAIALFFAIGAGIGHGRGEELDITVYSLGISVASALCAWLLMAWATL